ncbi:MAG: Rieske 2Fe-2S domain-containing protein [Pseudomonadota bacterium]
MTDIAICAAGALRDNAKGIRFPITAFGADATGFVVRFQGSVYGYVNRCAHLAIELDWNEGEFFDTSGMYLMCAVHGAMYLPESGRCTGGPCRGQALQKIQVFEREGQIFWTPDEHIRPIRA